MRILIVTVQVPFVQGGAEILTQDLRTALAAAGHTVDVVAIPFKWYPPERVLDHMLACRLLDLTESVGTPVDRVIALKFPAYLVSHPNKVLWMVHQHRAAYDLWDQPYCDLMEHPDGPQVRDAIRHADRQAIAGARKVYTIAGNVSQRLKRYNGIEAPPLYPPPRHGEKFYCAPAEPYLFFPSRLTTIKRQSLVLEALAHTQQEVRVRFAGTADQPEYAEKLKQLAAQLGVEHRVEWLDAVDAEELRRQYAHALAVVFPPVDEDYGYVTLEAMLAAKPVITCTDSGGPLEFVLPGQTGLVAEPIPEKLAAALDAIWHDPERARAWGEAGRAHYHRLGIGWPQVVQRLVA
jgi:glycosyltransferase involved in cell wall biosynthesis